jgi:hypothetical protein
VKYIVYEIIPVLEDPVVVPAMFPDKVPEAEDVIKLRELS